MTSRQNGNSGRGSNGVRFGNRVARWWASMRLDLKRMQCAEICTVRDMDVEIDR